MTCILYTQEIVNLNAGKQQQRQQQNNNESSRSNDNTCANDYNCMSVHLRLISCASTASSIDVRLRWRYLSDGRSDICLAEWRTDCRTRPLHSRHVRRSHASLSSRGTQSLTCPQCRSIAGQCRENYALTNGVLISFHLLIMVDYNKHAIFVVKLASIQMDVNCTSVVIIALHPQINIRVI